MFRSAPLLHVPLIWLVELSWGPREASLIYMGHHSTPWPENHVSIVYDVHKPWLACELWWRSRKKNFEKRGFSAPTSLSAMCFSRFLYMYICILQLHFVWICSFLFFSYSDDNMLVFQCRRCCLSHCYILYLMASHGEANVCIAILGTHDDVCSKLLFPFAFFIIIFIVFFSSFFWGRNVHIHLP